MKRILFQNILVIAVMFLSCVAVAGRAFVQASEPKIVDFILVKNTVLALKDNGSIAVCEINGKRTDSVVLPQDDAGKILSIAKSSKDDVYFGTEKGGIYKLDKMGVSSHLKIKYPVRFLVVNSMDRIIAIVPHAVYDPVTHKYWDKFSDHTRGIVRKDKLGREISTYFQMPQYIFLDNHDVLWMGASFGEFGGSLEIFDSRKLQVVNPLFDSLNFGLLFPKSIFQGYGEQVILTSGLQHFSNSGAIYSLSVNGRSSKLFDNRGRRKIDRKTKVVTDEGGLFIGPGAYNEMDSSIYFSTDRGIFKAKLRMRGQLTEPQLVANPSLSWSGEPLAIGAAMAYKKMLFSDDGELIFLTTNNGIGVLQRDGKVRFLRI